VHTGLNIKLKIIVIIMFLSPIFIMKGTGARKGVIILAYHAVNNNIKGIEELFVKPEEFYKQIEYMSKRKYTPLHFNEVSSYWKYKKPVIITFDDGYVDNYHIAYPILKKFNFKATVFMVAGYVNKPGYLNEAQIKEMKDIISFQSHTLSHPELDKLNEEELENEFVESKAIIEEITGEPVYTIAYPYGCYNQKVADIAAKHYSYAVNTKKGVYDGLAGNYEINRICICRSNQFGDFMRLIH